MAAVDSAYRTALVPRCVCATGDMLTDLGKDIHMLVPAWQMLHMNFVYAPRMLGWDTDTLAPVKSIGMTMLELEEGQESTYYYSGFRKVPKIIS